MSQLITVPQISVPAAQLPVAIDYPAALALRQIFRWRRPTRLCNWPPSNSARKKRQERPGEHLPAVRHIVWCRCQINSTSASWR